MKDPHFSEDEQAEKLKQWWKQNGTAVITGVVIGLGSIFGVNYWNDYQTARSERASVAFEQMLAAEPQAALEIGANLLADYAATPYAGTAALYLAKTHYENGDAEQAEEKLRWAMQNAEPRALQHTARLRLARLLMDSGELEAARGLLAEVADYGGFESEYQETLGDISMARGDPSAARSAYEQAIQTLPPASSFSEMLKLKLDQAIAESQK